MMFMQFFLIFFIKAYVVGTHLNCIDKLEQFKWLTHNICLYKETDKKYIGCYLKSTELLDCAYRGLYEYSRPLTFHTVVTKVVSLVENG